MHTDYIERTRAAVARAQLADELEAQVHTLQTQLESTLQREHCLREKLQLVVEQFRSQGEIVKESAKSALEVRRKLEAEAEQLRKETQEQQSTISKLKSELDNALLLRSGSKRGGGGGVDSSFLSPMSSVLGDDDDDGDEQQQQLNSPLRRKLHSGARAAATAATTPLSATTSGRPRDFRADPISSTVVLLSPPPMLMKGQSQHNLTLSGGENSVAFSRRHSLLNSKRLSKMIGKSYGQQQLQQVQQQQHPPRLTHQQRQLCSARLAARVALGLFSHRVHVERCFPASSTIENNLNSMISAFRVGQLVGGWWKYSVTSVPVPTGGVTASSDGGGGVLSQVLPVRVSASFAMRRPPKGTVVDFSSLAECQAEAALCSTSEDHFQQPASGGSNGGVGRSLHRILGVISPNDKSNHQNNNNNSCTSSAASFPVSSLEYLASWTGLRPKQLRPIPLQLQDELEDVLDTFIQPGRSVLYMTNAFSRRECFVVDSSRMGRERLCCCVAVAGLGMLGSSCNPEGGGGSPGHPNHNLGAGSSSSLPPLEAAWLTVQELRENFASCVCVDQHPQKTATTTTQATTMQPPTTPSSATTTEIRFPCLLDGETGKCVGSVSLSIRNIFAEAGLEAIEDWISQFAVDFYICDVAMFVDPQQQQQQQQSAEQEENGTTRTQQHHYLRTDIASPGLIRWTFAKGDENGADDDSSSPAKQQKAAEIGTASQSTTAASPAKAANNSNTNSVKKARPTSPPKVAVTTTTEQQTKEQAIKTTTTTSNNDSIAPSSTNILMRFRCADTNAVARAITPGNRSCSAVCIVHIPSPPSPSSSSVSSASPSSSCCTPFQTLLTLNVGASLFEQHQQTQQQQQQHKQQRFFINAMTFQINGETLPSTSSQLKLVCGRNGDWQMLGNVGGATNLDAALVIAAAAAAGAGNTTSNHNTAGISPLPKAGGFSFDNDEFSGFLGPRNNNSSSNELDPLRSRAYEVFGIGLAAAEAWMSHAGSWMTRFNTFKALLLFESCRATEASALKNATYLRRALLSNYFPTSPDRNGNNNNNNNNNNTSLSSSILRSPQTSSSHYAQFLLVYRFGDWMEEATELFAWSFDAVISEFFACLVSGRVAVGATDERALLQMRNGSSKNSSKNATTNNDVVGVARAIFTSPSPADGGDEFLLEDSWSNLCDWQRECMRARVELLLHWADCVADEAAQQLAARATEFQRAANELMEGSRMEVFVHKVANSLREGKHHNQQQRQRQEDAPVASASPYDSSLAIGSLRLRIAALEMQLRDEREIADSAVRRCEEIELKRQQEIQNQQLQQQNRSSSVTSLNMRRAQQQQQQLLEQQQQEEQNRLERERKKQQHQQEAQEQEHQLQQRQLRQVREHKQQLPQQSTNESHQLQIEALQDRNAALQMECETLALRLDASEKRSAAHVERASSLQQQLDRAQSEAKDHLAELARLRAAIDSQVQLAIERERSVLARDAHNARSHAQQLEEECKRKDKLISELTQQLETQQRERMQRYSDMLKEMSVTMSSSPLPPPPPPSAALLLAREHSQQQSQQLQHRSSSRQQEEQQHQSVGRVVASHDVDIAKIRQQIQQERQQRLHSQEQQHQQRQEQEAEQRSERGSSVAREPSVVVMTTNNEPVKRTTAVVIREQPVNRQQATANTTTTTSAAPPAKITATKSTTPSKVFSRLYAAATVPTATSAPASGAATPARPSSRPRK